MDKSLATLPEGFVIEPELPEGFIWEETPQIQRISPEEEERQNRQILDISEKTGESPAKLMRRQTLINKLFKDEDYDEAVELRQEEKREMGVSGYWSELIDATARGATRIGASLNRAMAFMSRKEFGSPFARPKEATPEQIKAREETAKEFERQAEFYWEIANHPELAPQREGKINKAINLIGETIPYITATTAAYTIGGPLGGFAVGSLVEGNSAYQEAIDSGVSEDKAKLIGIGVGIASGAVEAFGGKYAEELANRVTSKLTKELAKAGAIFATGTVIEALEEGAQEIAQITGETTYREVEWDEIVNRILGSMAGGAFLGGTMRGLSIATKRLARMPDKPLIKKGMEPVETREEHARLEDDLTEAIRERTGVPEDVARQAARKAIDDKFYVPEKGELEEMRKPAEIPPITEAIPLPTETTQALEDELTREFAERMGVPEHIARQEVRRVMEEAEKRAAEAAPAIEAEERTKLEEELKDLQKEREKTLKLIAESEELGAPPEMVAPAKRALAEAERRINEIEQQLQFAEAAPAEAQVAVAGEEVKDIQSAVKWIKTQSTELAKSTAKIEVLTTEQMDKWGEINARYVPLTNTIFVAEGKIDNSKIRTLVHELYHSIRSKGELFPAEKALVKEEENVVSDLANRITKEWQTRAKEALEKLEGAEPGGGLAWQTALREAIKRREELQPTIEKEQAAGRARQAGGYMGYLEYLTRKGVPAKEALRRAKAAMKGDITEYQRFESLDNYMSEEAINNAYEDIRDTDRLQPFEKVVVEEAFSKIRDGFMIPPHQIEALKKWRPELADLLDAYEKRLPVIVRIFSKIESILGLLKFSASFDVQMRRQARWFRARHPKLYAQAVEKNLEAYISQKRADKMADEVETDPQYKLAKQHGVQFLKRQPKPGERPEQYISHLGEKVPILGKGYAASMRGFVDAFNWMQMQLWNYKINQWKAEGRDITNRDLDELAEFNNTFLGMQPAKTYFGRALRRVLAPVMWSPTLTWSRVRSPEMILTNKAMRMETAATLGSYIASGLMFMLAASFLAALLRKKDPVEWNPTSADFGKIKVHNTRIDVYGDGGPYIRAFMQFILQKKKNQAGRIRRDVGIEPIKQLLRNKRAPFIDFISQVWTKRNYYGGPAYALPDWAEIKEEDGYKKLVAKAGEKITEPKEGEIAYYITRDLLVRPFVPFFVQGTIEAAWNDGMAIGLWAGMEEFFSGTTLSYEPSYYSQAQLLQDQAAVSKYDKLWEDLSIKQQEQIRKEVPEINEYEEKAAFERLPSEEISLSEMNKAARNVTKSLPEEIRDMLDRSQVRLTAPSRKIGEFWLNDKRYETYQQYYSEEVIKTFTKSRIKSLKDDREKIRKFIAKAKEKARNRLKIEINKGKL